MGIDHLLLLLATIGVLITGLVTAGIQLRKFIMGLRREHTVASAERESLYLSGAQTAFAIMADTLAKAHEEIEFWHKRALELEEQLTAQSSGDTHEQRHTPDRRGREVQ